MCYKYNISTFSQLGRNNIDQPTKLAGVPLAQKMTYAAASAKGIFHGRELSTGDHNNIIYFFLLTT